MTGPNVEAYVAARKAADPTNASVWDNVATLCGDRLWHQLTQLLLNLTLQEHFVALSEKDTRAFFTEFVYDFEKHISRISLAELALRVSDRVEDHQQAIDFLNTFHDKVKEDVMASVLVRTQTAELELQQVHLSAAYEILTECETALEGLYHQTTDQRVHGALYRVLSDYYKAKGDYAQYYTCSLRYLGCVDAASVPNPRERGCDVILAALLADKIYSFGELLNLSILSSLDGSNEAWLIDLVRAFSDGDIDALEQLQPKWTQVKDLEAQQANLKRKMCLLCLMDLVFRHPDSNRRLSLTSVAERTRLQLNEVEFLIMKALSLNLIEGAIDQVEGVVHVTWVKPRVLTKSQISVLASRVSTWSEKVQHTSEQIHM